MSEIKEDKSGVYFEISDSERDCGMFEIISRVSSNRTSRRIGHLSSLEVRDGDNSKRIFVSHCSGDIIRYLRDSANMIEEEIRRRDNSVPSIDHSRELELLREIKGMATEVHNLKAEIDKLKYASSKS